MRSLIAIAALVACSGAWAQIQLNEISNDTVADADKVMENFNKLGDAIDALPTPPTNCDTNQIIKWDGSAWVCASPQSATQPQITASLYSQSFSHAGMKPLFHNFQSISNADGTRDCSGFECFIDVHGVPDHRNCTAIASGAALAANPAAFRYFLYTIEVTDLRTWVEGGDVYIDISCDP